MDRTSGLCCGYRPAARSRREMLRQVASGFGMVALAGLLNNQSFPRDVVSATVRPSGSNPRQHRPRAKSVIYLYMDGGPSQVDTFDPKPRLTRENGQPFAMKVEPTQFNNNGATLASPWTFRNYGESGLPVSELFPMIAMHADKLAVIRSMVSEFSEHTNANYFMHTGNGFQGRPSMGSWVQYGLGTENEDLPGFVVLNGGLIPPGGVDCFNAGFLPASYQGSLFDPSAEPLANISRNEPSQQLQRHKLSFVDGRDEAFLTACGYPDAVESAIANYELAFRMQTTVPELAALHDEPAYIQSMYGVDSSFKPLAIYARECLLARRMVERGVRFIELTCPSVGHDRWDQHGNLRAGHALNALAVDQPIAALLTDLDQRGLLDETLVIWGGEFGRTPFAQGTDGRDHDPFAFSIWLAGAGIRGGTIHGETDEYGYKAIRDRVEVHDLHATMLHLLGIDHKQLTYRFGGRDMRLTDVKGNVVHEILA
jgi:Protein of unknown function (DUF1501)